MNKSGPNSATASDYTIHVDGNNQSPDTFPGSEDGTDVTIGFGSYSVSEIIGPQVHFSGKSNLAKIVKGSSIQAKQRLVLLLTMLIIVSFC